MSPEENDRLEELVDLWEDSRERGTPIPPEVLCRESPELLAELQRYIRELEVADRFLFSTAGEGRQNRPEGPSTDFRAGRYRAERLLDRGGFAEVFVAFDEELRRPVALKCPKSNRAWDREGRAQFVLEAEVTGRLEHPGVVPVYGLGHDSRGIPYYAMRLIGGQTLDQAIERFHAADGPGRDPGERTMAFQKLLRAFLSVCEAIGYAHSRNVLHRDLKPANIRLGDFGEVLVLDWGLAKIIGPADGDSRAEHSTQAPPSESGPVSPVNATGMGQIKGTPAYMSPEQAIGDSTRVGLSADLFGLGATLYKLLTGEAPYGGALLSEVLQKVRRGDFLPPRRRNPAVPRGLEAICLKAMQFDPADRYHDARALAADVEHWLADEPVVAWREPLLTRAQRWLRKHRTIVVATAATMIVTMAMLSGFTVVLQAENQKLAAANLELQRSNDRERAARENADRNLLLAFRHVGEIASVFQQPQLVDYRNTFVVRTINDSLVQQLGRLVEVVADGTASSPLADEMLIQRKVLELQQVMNQHVTPDQIDAVLIKLKAEREALQDLCDRHPADSWSRFHIGMSYFTEAQLMVGAGRNTSGRQNFETAFQYFIANCDPGSSSGVTMVESAARAATILSTKLDPKSPPDPVKTQKQIATVLELIDQIRQRGSADDPVPDRILCWKGLLLGASAATFANDRATLVEAETAANAALKSLASIQGPWREHSLFYRARWSARSALGHVKMFPQPSIAAWELYRDGVDDLRTAIELASAIRTDIVPLSIHEVTGHSLTEVDRLALSFNELTLALIGAELVPGLRSQVPAEQSSRQQIIDRSMLSIQRCEEFEKLVPEEARDPRMASTLQSLRTTFDKAINSEFR
jgi:serine/threonine protein kinase